MKSLATALFVTALMSYSGHHLHADVVTFDFGNANTGNNSQNGGDGNWTPFADETTSIGNSASIVIGGLQMTINGVAVDGNATADEFWGINNQGIGIHTDGGSGGTSRRIDGGIGEAVTFNFDQDVNLTSLRLGSFAGDNTVAETATVAVSGGPTITITSDVSSTTQPLTDWTLSNTFVSAGTLITLTTSDPLGGGVLFNEITVTTAVPEPGSLLFVGGTVFAFAFRRRRTR